MTVRCPTALDQKSSHEFHSGTSEPSDEERDASGSAVRGLREIDDDQAAIVRRIFSEYAAGFSPVAIVQASMLITLPGHAEIEAAGATLRFLPPYSPDVNPIEKAFSKPKAMLRKIGERTVNGLWDLIGRLVDIFQPCECAKYLTSCGYDTD